jgi:hypothetical protein
MSEIVDHPQHYKSCNACNTWDNSDSPESELSLIIRLECCEFINPLLCKDLCPQKFALRIPDLLMLDVRMRVLGIRKVMKWLIFPSENVVNPCYARDTRIHNTQD